MWGLGQWSMMTNPHGDIVPSWTSLAKQDLIISHLYKITTITLFHSVSHVGGTIWIKKCRWLHSCAGIGWLPHVSEFPLFPRLLMDLKPWRTRRGFYPFNPWVNSTSLLRLYSTCLIYGYHPVKKKEPLPTLPQMYIQHLLLLCKSSGFCLQSPGKWPHRNRQTFNSIQFTGVFINCLSKGNVSPQTPLQPPAAHWYKEPSLS